MSIRELSHKYVDLERALEFERRARKDAEEALRKKTISLSANIEKLHTSTERLQLALWASETLVWEWFAEDDVFRLYSNISEDKIKVHQKGTFTDLIESLHPNYKRPILDAWEAHVKGATNTINQLCIRYSETRKRYRWIRIKGKIVERTKEGLPVHFLGTLSDVTKQVKREKTLECVTNAFNRAFYPSFIYDFEQKQLEGNEAFYHLFKCDHDSADHKAIISALPIQEVLLHRLELGAKFHASIKWPSLADKKYYFYMPKMLTDEESLRYCVAVIMPDDKSV